MVTMLSGCGTQVSEQAADTIEVTDCAGRTVSVPADPQSVSCVCPFSGAYIVMFGAGDTITTACNNMTRSFLLASICPSVADAIVVKSSAQGIVQHDGFSWQILKNRFEPSSPSPLSDFMETTVRAWSDELDDAQWKVIVDLIFSMLEATGFDTLSSINEQKRRSIEAMFSALRQLPKKEQAEGLAILGHLTVSSSHSAAQFLQSRQEKQNPQ